MSSTNTKLVPVLLLALLGLGGLSIYGVIRATRPVPAGANAAAPSSVQPGASGRRAIDEAGTLMRQGQPSQAEALLRRAIESSPRDQDLRLALVQALIPQKKLDAALEQYEHAIKIGPDAAALRFEAGSIAHVAGKLELAATHYRVAQGKNPSEPEYAFRLAVVSDQLGRGAQARAELLTVLRLREDHAGAYALLAEIELRDNEPKLAVQHAARAREIEPNQLAWRLVEARALKRDNQPQRAVELLIGLAWEHQGRPEVLSVLGDCLGMLGKPADSAALYARAAAEQTGDAGVQYQAALWAQRAGRTDEARKYAQIAADLGSAEAKSLLNGL